MTIRMTLSRVALSALALFSLAVAGVAADKPLQLPVTDGLVCWVRATAGVITDTTDNANPQHVSLWMDQSGAGNDFSFANVSRGSTPPSLVANGMGEKQPALGFMGIKDTNACGLGMAKPITVGTVFLVFRLPDDKKIFGPSAHETPLGGLNEKKAATRLCFYGIRDSAAAYLAGSILHPATVHFDGTTANAVYKFASTNAPILTPLSQITVMSGNVWDGTKDGPQTLDALQVGHYQGHEPWEGFIAEVALYNRTLTDDERSLVEKAIMARYTMGPARAFKQ